MGIRCANHVIPLYPQKLALTSPTDGGRSVGMVRSRTKATEFSLVYVCILCMYVCILCVYVCMYVCMCVCMYVFCVCMYVCMYVCVYVCMYFVCVCMYVCIVCMYVRIFVCVHIR